MRDLWIHRQAPFTVPELLASQSRQFHHAPLGKDVTSVMVLLSHSVFRGLGSAQRVGSTNVFEKFYF